MKEKRRKEGKVRKNGTRRSKGRDGLDSCDKKQDAEDWMSVLQGLTKVDNERANRSVE